MTIRGNGKGCSLELSMTSKEWNMRCGKGAQLVLGLSSLVWV
jgi:hypothetical protein